MALRVLTLAIDGGKLSASHCRSSSLVVDPAEKSHYLCYCCSSAARSSSPQKIAALLRTGRRGNGAGISVIIAA
jgi:uncharacterized protein (UPF0262 family)